MSVGKLRELVDCLEDIKEISIAEIDLIFDGGILTDFNQEIKDVDQGFQQVLYNFSGSERLPIELPVRK
jgi:hypothetical protein